MTQNVLGRFGISKLKILYYIFVIFFSETVNVLSWSPPDLGTGAQKRALTTPVAVVGIVGVVVVVVVIVLAFIVVALESNQSRKCVLKILVGKLVPLSRFTQTPCQTKYVFLAEWRQDYDVFISAFFSTRAPKIVVDLYKVYFLRKRKNFNDKDETNRVLKHKKGQNFIWGWLGAQMEAVFF